MTRQGYWCEVNNNLRILLLWAGKEPNRRNGYLQRNKLKTEFLEVIIHCFKEKFVFDIDVFDLVEVIKIAYIR